jgi:hypothetical protein
MKPSWHPHAKWLSALAAVLLVFAASASYTLYRLTEHDTATGAFTAIAVSLLEDRVDTEEFQQVMNEAAANPDAEYTLPGVNVTVTGQELADRTPTEALNLVVSRTADTLYYEGADSAQPLFSEEPGDAADGQEDQEPSVDTGTFFLLSEGTHDFLQPLIYAFVLTAIVSMVLLTLLSRGFGRLGSPSLAFLTVIAPLALLWTVGSRAADKMAEKPDDLTSRLAVALTPVLDDLSRDFLVLAAVGGATAALAVIGHIATLAIARSRAGQPEAEADVEAEPAAEPPVDEEPPAQGDEFPSIGRGGVPQA